MGAKTWMLVAADGNPRDLLRAAPALDREASLSLARRLFPRGKLRPLDDGNLAWTNPPDNELVIGCFPGLCVLAAKEFALDRPSQLPTRFLEAGLGRSIHLHAMHSVVDWFAFAVWQEGKLVRSLSLAPDNGIIEDIGARLPFELPYWAGEHPAVEPGEEKDAYPFPFHPLDLGEAALQAFFGYQLEGTIDPSFLEPESVPLLRFKRPNPWWKPW